MGAGREAAKRAVAETARPGQKQRHRRDPLTLEDLRPLDRDAEAGKADVAAFACRQEADRADAEVLQDLGAEADLAPLALARRGGAMCLVGRPMNVAVAAAGAGDADRPFAEIDDNAAAGAETCHHPVKLALGGEDVVDDRFAMQADRHTAAVVD